MKIVCDACAAKYSIADEKVRGKVFKIRCKKCSNIIVVRGAVSEAAEPAQPKYDPKSTKVLDYQTYEGQRRSESGAELTESAVWHLVIDQEQVGPLTVEEVLGRFQRGDIDGDGYVWREGFGDWERLADVEVFAGMAGGRGDAGLGALFGSSGHDGEQFDDRSAGGQSDPGDLFAARGAGDDAATADLFGGPAMVPPSAHAGDADALFAGGGEMEMGMDGGGRSGGSSKSSSPLTGQRNENSVLFSLNNLAALASDAPRSAPMSSSSSPSSSSSSSMQAASASGTPPPSEGSGLIDIRSMAQVYLGETKAPPSRSVGAGSTDDLPVFSQAAFESASPVLLPSMQPAVNNRLLFALVGLIGVLVIAAVVLVVVVLKGGDQPQPKVAAVDPAPAGAVAPPSTPAEPAASATTPPAGDSKSGQPAGSDPTPPPAGEPVAATTPPAADEPEGEGKEPEPRSSDRDRKDRDRDKKDKKDRDRDRRNGRRDSSSSRDKEPEREATPPPAPDPMASSGCDEVTCLVEPDKPCCKKYARRSGGSRSDSGSSSADPNLQERPSRADVSSGIGDVKGSVSSCGSRAPGGGKVTVKIKISPSGSVASAKATGGSSSLNGCVESAVKRARFPKSQLGASVNYPFIF
jgi:predicted Zn finger-like uncharacterized protein